MTILLTVLCFLSGSLMFSFWLGIFIRKNIREVGDGNPGAANLWKAAGFKYGIIGILLDFLKGYIPLIIILKSALISDNQLIPVALAPIYGHAFSPFLKCNGGKSLAVSFGVWSALTAFHASLTYAIILAILSFIIRLLKKGKRVTSEEDGFQTTLGMILLGVYLYYFDFPGYILWIWLGNVLLLFYKNKKGIDQLIKSKKQEKEHFPI